MQLNRVGLLLAALTNGNRHVQVANFIYFKVVNFGPEAIVDRITL